MKIGFFGINPKSVSFSILLSKKGIDCYFYDENEDLVFNLNNKIFITEEPLIQMNLIDSNKISASTDVTFVVKFSDMIFDFIDLPSNIDGSIDSDPIIESLQKFYLCSHLDISLFDKDYIVSTTLNIGSCKLIKEKISQFGLNIGYFPNFFKEGSIFESMNNNTFYILGSDSHDLETRFSDLFSIIKSNQSNLTLMSLESAEITKFAISAINASKIVISNLIGDFMISIGLEKEIALMMNAISKNENSNYHNIFYGSSFGGPKLTQEICSISKFAEERKTEINIFEFINRSNDEHLNFIKFYYMTLNPNKNTPFVFDCIGYKKKSNTLQNSQNLKLCLNFLDEGYNVNVIQDKVDKKLETLSYSYGNRLKFFKKGTNPEGFKINL